MIRGDFLVDLRRFEQPTSLRCGHESQTSLCVGAPVVNAPRCRRICDAVAEILTAFLQTECANYLKNAGYA